MRITTMRQSGRAVWNGMVVVPRAFRQSRRKTSRYGLGLEFLEQRLALSTFYVAPTGSDSNAGTQASPFATFQHALISLKPGDTLDAEPGTYSGFIAGWDSTPASSGDPYGTIDGTASEPITIQAAPSAARGSVIIDSANSETHSAIDLEPGNNYITISGLTITNAAGNVTNEGIKIVSSSNDTISNCTVSGVGGWGMFVDTTTNLVIKNNTVTGTTGSGDEGHGMYISGSTSGAVVEGNDVYDNGFIGIHINGDLSEGNTGLVSNSIIEDNVIYGNGQNGINADGLVNSVIENNLIYNYANYGICLYQINAASGPGNDVIVNNTIDTGTSSGTSAAICISNASATNSVLDNIFLGGGGLTESVTASSMTDLVSNYNVVGSLFQNDTTGDDESLAAWQSQTGQDENSIVATSAALFVSPSTGNYLELSNSPSIGAGTSTDSPSKDIVGNPRPSGNGYDIGCYEYETSVPERPTVTSVTPAANSTGVATNSTLTATFNESVEATSINTANLVLTSSSGSTVAASVSYSSTSNTATITPTGLLANSTTYTATISNVLSTAGVAMASAYSWSFTTGPAPTVTSHAPASGVTGVAVSTSLTATFNEPVQPGTISFTFHSSSSGTPVPATLTYNSSTNTATLKPTSNLANGTTYIVTVAGAEDSAGDPMAAPFYWSFTTSRSRYRSTTVIQSGSANRGIGSVPGTLVVGVSSQPTSHTPQSNLGMGQSDAIAYPALSFNGEAGIPGLGSDATSSATTARQDAAIHGLISQGKLGMVTDSLLGALVADQPHTKHRKAVEDASKTTELGWLGS